MLLNSPSLPHALPANDSMEMIQEEDEGCSSLKSSGVYAQPPRGSECKSTPPSSTPQEEISIIPAVERRQVDLKMSVRRRSGM